jgi:hypothetical protein
LADEIERLKSTVIVDKLASSYSDLSRGLPLLEAAVGRLGFEGEQVLGGVRAAVEGTQMLADKIAEGEDNGDGTPVSVTAIREWSQSAKAAGLLLREEWPGRY